MSGTRSNIYSLLNYGYIQPETLAHQDCNYKSTIIALLLHLLIISKSADLHVMLLYLLSLFVSWNCINIQLIQVLRINTKKGVNILVSMTHWEKIYSGLQLTNKKFVVRTTTYSVD